MTEYSKQARNRNTNTQPTRFVLNITCAHFARNDRGEGQLDIRGVELRHDAVCFEGGKEGNIS